MKHMTKIIKNLIIILIIIFLSLFFLELFFSLYLGFGKNKIFNKFTERSIFYQKGENFQNFSNFFKYYPNEKIRSLGLFYKKNPVSLDDLKIEYDYFLETNNLGLVMKNNILNNEEVNLIIGDSFTEGQGATPWFYELEEVWKFKHKNINLGILGTGPMQWLNLTDYIIKEKSLKINGIVINIILDDLFRQNWKFNDDQINCLRKAECTYSGYFQGIDFKKFKNYKEIKNYQINKSKNFNKSKEFKNFLNKLNVLNEINKYLRFYISRDTRIQNYKSIEKLTKYSNKNVYINIIPTKNISLETLKEDKIYKELTNYLRKYGFSFNICYISNDGFHLYDQHPNKYGYQKIKKCTIDGLNFIYKKN